MYQQQHITVRSFLPGIIWFIVLMVLICMPSKHLPQDKFFAGIFLDKLVHVGCFALLVWLFYYPFAKSSLPKAAKNNYLVKITLSAIMWGLATELIQRYFVPGRSFDLKDWLADAIGAALAFATVKWWPVKAKS
jgi:VanZ family protein